MAVSRAWAAMAWVRKFGFGNDSSKDDTTTGRPDNWREAALKKQK
jgi:hypothetical protein